MNVKGRFLGDLLALSASSSVNTGAIARTNVLNIEDEIPGNIVSKIVVNTPWADLGVLLPMVLLL